MPVRKYKPEQIIGCYRIIKFDGYTTTAKSRNSKYICECLKCGMIKSVFYSDIYRSIKTVSQKCPRCPKDRVIDHPLYNYWIKKIKNIHQLDPSWLNFEQFKKDVVTKPKYTKIIPINPQLPLGPQNFKIDKSNTKKPLTIFGITKSQSEWARICGITRERIRQRLQKYNPEQAILKYDKTKKYLLQHITSESICNEIKNYKEPKYKPKGRQRAYKDGDIIGRLKILGYHNHKYYCECLECDRILIMSTSHIKNQKPTHNHKRGRPRKI
ncbi:MAG: hypothetical protein H7831_06725 [Magnetococcus sp. WYHC-3]